MKTLGDHLSQSAIPGLIAVLSAVMSIVVCLVLDARNQIPICITVVGQTYMLSHAIKFIVADAKGDSE